MKKRKKCYVFSGFTLILALGLFFYSLMLFIINKKITLEDIQVTYKLGIQHLELRIIADKIITFSGTIYILGHLITLVVFIQKGYRFPIKTILQYYFSQISIMLLCTVPFSFMDKIYYKDYLFPIWNISITLLLVLLFYIISLFLKKKLYRKRE